jgi:hypothetical protein
MLTQRYWYKSRHLPSRRNRREEDCQGSSIWDYTYTEKDEDEFSLDLSELENQVNSD